MALTQKQKAAIQSQTRKNITQRAATQRTKISASEARTVSNKMNKRPGATKQPFILKDSALLSKSEKNTLGRTSKANAAKEKFIQKNRNFAKGTGKLPVKNRVGTKSEYKALGKEIEMRKQLIASGKVARASQAARAANPTPAKATPAKTATTLTKKSVVKKKAATPKPKAKVASTLREVKVNGRTMLVDKETGQRLMPVNEETQPKAAKTKPSRGGTTLTKPKASTEAIKKRTVPNVKAKVTEGKKPQTRPGFTASGSLKNKSTPSKLQTLEQAKASAPKPMVGPRKPTAEEFKTTMSKAPSNAPLKPSGKIASKVSNVKRAAGSTKVGNTVKAVAKTTAAKSVASKASSVAAKVGKSKLVKGAGFVTKAAAAVGAARETGQVVSGQAEKDFRRIQALENRVAAAKGQKPKYTKSGSNRNLGESLKVDAGNALSFIGLGKSRKARLTELKTMAAKAEKKKNLTKPSVKPAATASTPKPSTGSKPAAISGSKYRVNAGDTLSGIASRAGVSLKDLRSANPQITDPRKIYRNTGVVIPKSGKVPTGGYTKKAK